MGSGNANKLSMMSTDVAKVKTELAAYKLAVAAQLKVVTD
jgi:hypothetical protein